jgi:pimeloyl-ACP methyl ester carboxylesterase
LIDIVNVCKALVPEMRLHIDDACDEGGRQSIRWTASGAHRGAAFGWPPTGRQVVIHGAAVAREAAERTFTIDGTWGLDSLEHQVGLEPETLSDALLEADRAIALRATQSKPGVPVLFFPTMSLPGWITWKRCIDHLKCSTPVATFQLLCNRWALDGREPEAGYGVPSETRAIERALRRSGLEGPFDVVGHSAGGALALDFALKHPAIVRSLTLIEPVVPWVLREAGLMDDDLREFVQERLESYSGPITPERHAAVLIGIMPVGYDPTRSPFWDLSCAYAKSLNYRPFVYGHTDRFERLHSLDSPVLLIRGEGSHRFYHEIVRVLRDELPNVRAIEMPGAHIPHHGSGTNLFLKHLNEFHKAC